MIKYLFIDLNFLSSTRDTAENHLYSRFKELLILQVQKLNDLDNDLDLEMEKDDDYNADDGKPWHSLIWSILLYFLA